MIRQLPRRLNVHRHAYQLVLRQRVIQEFTAEHLALPGISQSSLKSGRHDAQSASSRLQAAAGKPLHLQIKAASQTGVAANQVLIGNKPIVENQFKGVHPAIADGGNGSARKTAVSPHMLKFVAIIGRFFHDEKGEAAMRFRHVWIGAGQNHEDVGAAGESTPGFTAVQPPTPLNPLRHRRQMSHIRAEVRFGDGHCRLFTAVGDERQPLLFLRLRAAIQQRFRQQFRSGDQAAGRAEGSPR